MAVIKLTRDYRGNQDSELTVGDSLSFPNRWRYTGLGPITTGVAKTIGRFESLYSDTAQGDGKDRLKPAPLAWQGHHHRYVINFMFFLYFTLHTSFWFRFSSTSNSLCEPSRKPQCLSNLMKNSEDISDLLIILQYFPGCWYGLMITGNFIVDAVEVRRNSKALEGLWTSDSILCLFYQFLVTILNPQGAHEFLLDFKFLLNIWWDLTAQLLEVFFNLNSLFIFLGRI